MKVIQVENLGKSYIIDHEERERYTALRDVITNKFVEGSKKFINIFSPNVQRPVTNNQREEFWALRNVSFEVNQGDRIGIIGRNGAGKSTLLKLLSRITEPTKGVIKIKGRVASLLEVGTGFHPELTGRENIYLNGAILGMSRTEIKKKFDEIVDFAEIEKFLDTPVKRYSSGMYIRLAFAVAAHLEPEILLIDEVLAVGDAQFQIKCLGKMKDVSRSEGRTILFVSHNMAAIKDLCSDSLLLNNGLLESYGESYKIINLYVNKISEYKFESMYKQKPSIMKVEIDQKELDEGNLEIYIYFKSPFVLKPPAAGIVVYNILGNPIFTSNPRMHNNNFQRQDIQEGIAIVFIKELPLLSGRYKVSVWLGDQQGDYDYIPDALTFEYISRRTFNQVPDTTLVGSVDVQAFWRIKKVALF